MTTSSDACPRNQAKKEKRKEEKQETLEEVSIRVVDDGILGCVLECALEVVVRQRVVFSPQLEEGSVVVQNRAVFGFCGVEVTELSTNQQHTLSGFCAHSSQVLMRVVKTVVKTVLKTEVKTEPVRTALKYLVKSTLLSQ